MDPKDASREDRTNSRGTDPTDSQVGPDGLQDWDQTGSHWWQLGCVFTPSDKDKHKLCNFSVTNALKTHMYLGHMISMSFTSNVFSGKLTVEGNLVKALFSRTAK